MLHLPDGFAVCRVPGRGSPAGEWRIIGDPANIPSEKTATIYALQEQYGTDYSIKIGMTTQQDPGNSYGGRYQAIRNGNWRSPQVVAQIVGTRQVERELHKRFDHLRIHRNCEWFHPHPELISYLHQIRRDFPELQPPTEPRLP